MNKHRIDRYYRHLRDGTVLKCIDKVEGIYFFKRVDGRKYSKLKCDRYKKSSRVCQKCTRETVCFLGFSYKLEEVPYLKAILLYGE